MKMKRVLALIFSILMLGSATSILAGCGKKGGATHFTIWIPQGENSSLYGLDYAKNPVVKYLQTKEWDAEGDGNGVKLSFEWQVPPTGGAIENLSTAISTNTYADVIDVSSASSIMSVRSMYDEGMILDLTQYVDKYMPNYKAFLDANPELKQTASILTDDGAKNLQIWAYQGERETMWGGWLYRRDWIVKYGKNPSTQAAFTAEGYTAKNKAGENDKWVDDVMFPSWYGLDAKGNAMAGPSGQDFKTWYKTIDPNWNGQDPVTISDWEWMLQIFEDALKAESITDGYPMGMFSPGFYEVGDLASSFGGGPTWYLSENKTKANFGFASDAFRQYLIMANKWYAEGWINKTFNESNKIFYEADNVEAPQGKVGLWYGLNSHYGDQLAASMNKNKDELFVVGARLPINTTYGADNFKYQIPTLMYQTTREMRSFVITDKASKKDIASFCRMMDYNYTEEGAVLQGYGLPKAQYEEYKAATGKTDELMEKYANENGEVVYNNGSGWSYADTGIDDNVENALRGSRLWGYCPRWELMRKDNYPATNLKCTTEWTFYPLTGDISGSLISQLDVDEGDAFAKLKTDVRSWAAQNVYRYVKGELNPNNDANWTNFVRQVNNLKPANGTKILQDLLDALNA